MKMPRFILNFRNKINNSNSSSKIKLRKMMARAPNFQIYKKQYRIEKTKLIS